MAAVNFKSSYNYTQLHQSCLPQWPQLAEVYERLKERNRSRGVAAYGIVAAMEPSGGMSVDWLAGFLAGLTQAQNEYEPRIVALEARVSELEARIAESLDQAYRPPQPPKTSQNSSLPPSSDLPNARKRSPKHPTGRKRGAQKGHRGLARQMVDADQVDEVIDHHPHECVKCRAALSSEPPDAVAPIRRQAWELPRVKPIVTEHRQLTVECPKCHSLIKAPDREVPLACERRLWLGCCTVGSDSACGRRPSCSRWWVECQ